MDYHVKGYVSQGAFDKRRIHIYLPNFCSREAACMFAIGMLEEHEAEIVKIESNDQEEILVLRRGG